MPEESELESALKRMEAVQAIVDIAIEPLELDELLHALLERLRSTVGADTATILLREGDVLVVRASSGLEGEVDTEQRVPIGRGVAGRVASTRMSMVIDDLREHETWSHLLRMRLRSLAAVPLVYGDEVLGVLHVGTEEARDLRGDLVLLELVANRAAAAITRVQAEEERRRSETRARLLADFSQELSGSIEDVRRPLQLTAERIAATIGDTCALYLLSEDGRSLEAVALHHRDPEQLKLARLLVAPAVGLESDLGSVVRTGESLSRFDLSADQFRALLTPEQKELLGDRFVVSSLITVPLRARGEVVGAVNIARTSPGAARYTESDKTFLEELAERAGVAIDNARMYAQSHESAQRFRALFDSSRIGFVARDVDGRVVETNQAYAAMMGYESADDLRGTKLEAVLGEDVFDYAQHIFGEAFEGVVDQREFNRDYARRDGTEVHVHVSTSLVRDVNGLPLYSMSLVEDVGIQRSLEQQLRESQKMEALGRFAGGIAHDFNNVLMAVAGFGELISDRLAPDDPLQSEASEIRLAASRATGLTRQLLTFSRNQVVEQQAIEIGGVARGLVPMLERLLGEDVELELTVADDAGAVLADHGQLEQVLVNLAVNAGDAMPGGGRLVIGVDAADVDEGLAHARLELEPGRYVVVTVSDTGVGIDAETQNHIFEPFFTTKPPDQGTGLGLSTVFGIVKQGGGSITVYSESGHGTTFRVYLPRTEEVPERALRPPPRLPREIAAPGGTILVVDDERVVRRVVARMLERSGYTVLTAGDGPEALEISDTHEGRIDLLLTDMVLPGMPGPEVAEMLTSRRPETRVLFSSGYPGDEITRRGLNADSPYLEKPFSHETLSLVVSGLLEGADKVEG